MFGYHPFRLRLLVGLRSRYRSGGRHTDLSAGRQTTVKTQESQALSDSGGKAAQHSNDFTVQKVSRGTSSNVFEAVQYITRPVLRYSQILFVLSSSSQRDISSPRSL